MTMPPLGAVILAALADDEEEAGARFTGDETNVIVLQEALAATGMGACYASLLSWLGLMASCRARLLDAPL